MKQLHISKYTFISLISCVGLILGYIESLIPLFSALPGIKLGISNVVVIYSLYKYNWQDALLVGVFKSLLSSILFAGLMSFFYSLTGIVLSVTVMQIFKKLFDEKVSVVGVSIAGSSAFNIGQILACCIILSNTSPVYYLGILLMFSVISGAFTGILSKLLLDRI